MHSAEMSGWRHSTGVDFPAADEWIRSGPTAAVALAIRAGTFAHTFAWARQRDHLPERKRPAFDRTFSIPLRRSVAQTLE